MRFNSLRRGGVAFALASLVLLLAPEAALALCADEAVAGVSPHLLKGLVGTLLMTLAAGGLFVVLREARAEDRSEAPRAPAKAVTS